MSRLRFSVLALALAASALAGCDAGVSTPGYSSARALSGDGGGNGAGR